MEATLEALVAAGLEPTEAEALRWGDVHWLRSELEVMVAIDPGPPPRLITDMPPRTVLVD